MTPGRLAVTHGCDAWAVTRMGCDAGISAARQLSPGCGGVLDVQGWGPHVIVYATQLGGVHAWDLRVKQVGWFSLILIRLPSGLLIRPGEACDSPDLVFLGLCSPYPI